MYLIKIIAISVYFEEPFVVYTSLYYELILPSKVNIPSSAEAFLGMPTNAATEICRQLEKNPADAVYNGYLRVS